ncbi:hypothetical protein BJ508DRAFT_85493 [Ascobolus immersus RN42]|uniref:Uncharacterized protein n=1 Tax=Ascobolus immersus RN42 TaxID=1160509 RepID=A0A3N4HF08_ASCIM|nr:hypothetical protein BJ508DRAFT_85493 [Ascobolus immersus RN42]
MFRHRKAAHSRRHPPHGKDSHPTIRRPPSLHLSPTANQQNLRLSLPSPQSQSRSPPPPPPQSATTNHILSPLTAATPATTRTPIPSKRHRFKPDSPAVNHKLAPPLSQTASEMQPKHWREYNVRTSTDGQLPLAGISEPTSWGMMEEIMVRPPEAMDFALWRREQLE